MTLSADPSRLIAELDEVLPSGQAVTLLRRGSPEIRTTIKAHVRGAKPEELAAGISQSARVVTFSPTGLEAWSLLPGPDDLVSIGDEAFLSITAKAEVIRVKDVVVRIRVVVEG